MGLSLVHVFGFVLVLGNVYCKSDVEIGYKVTIAVPIEYSEGFTGRAFLMETNQQEPNFKTALSAEPMNGKYSCSLQVFLGGVKVWNSGHYWPFLVEEECVLELTNQGDLQLKGGPKHIIGWRTATSGQGVERLQILATGNLVLVDALSYIKWQSFNFPTDVILWGQRLNVATRLTSFPANSTAFYSLQIQHDKISLYLNSANSSYSYWQFKPSKNRNISFLQLASKGLEFFNQNNHKISQIPSLISHPLRFLALSNKTGNLGLFFYSPEKSNFEAAFQALNTTCDHPLACKPYGICTLSNTCSCIRFLAKQRLVGDCGDGFSGQFCGGRREVEMVELGGVATVLMAAAPSKVNTSKEECRNLCIQDCKCVAALYDDSLKRECFVFGIAIGAKEVERGRGMTYMVKVPKGSLVGNGKSGLQIWVLVIVGVVDGFIIVLIFGGFCYYCIRRRKNLATNSTS